MASLFVDYDALNDSISTLSSFSKANYHETLKGIIESASSKIKSISSSHDGCFDSISTESLCSETDSVDNGIHSLIEDIQNTLYTSLEYSLGMETNSEGVFFNSLYLIDYVSDNGLEHFLSQNGIEGYLNQKFGNGDVPLYDIISKGILLPGYDVTHYNDAMEKYNSTISSQRDRVVANAVFLSTGFPHLSYFYTGGHSSNITGVDSSWGTVKRVPAGENTGKERPYSLDCSGFVNWDFYNSGVSKNRINCSSVTGLSKGEKYSYYNLGNCESITSNGVFNRVHPGDLAYMPGHIGIVVYKNDNTITVAHVCDSGINIGMDLTKIDTNTGLIVDDALKPDRVGEPYFTDVIEVKYDDE